MKLGGVGILVLMVSAALCSGCGAARTQARSARAPGASGDAVGTTTITSSPTPRLILPAVQWDDDDIGLTDDDEASSSPLQTWGAPPEPYTGPVGKYGF